VYIALLFPFNIVYRQLEGTMAVENIRAKIAMHISSMLVRMILYAILFFFFSSNLIYPVLVTIIIVIIEIVYFLKVQKTLLIVLPIDKIIAIEALKFSFLPMITSLLVTLNYGVDIILLKHLGDPVELGIYSTASGLINYFWLIPDAFRDVLLSRVARNDNDKSTQLAIKVSVWSVVGVIIIFSVIGYYSIILLYGNEFAEAYTLVLILSIGIISMVYYKMIGVVMVAEGRTKQYFWFLLVSVLVNVGSNIITIPLWGMYGAAIASVLSYTLCGVLFLSYYARGKKIKLSFMLKFSKDEKAFIKSRLLRKKYV
jgi:O-antigen/teichoic acid export membrane protein